MQFCTKCGQQKDLKEFQRKSSRTKSTGVMTSSICNECQTEYKKEKYLEFKNNNTEKYVETYLKRNKENLEKNKLKDPYAAGGTKKCSICKEELDIRSFHKQGVASSGLAPSCFLCKWNKNHHKKFPDITLSWTSYKSMMEQQGGRCAICGNYEKFARLNRLSIDHDDNTGKIRGLLCSEHNTSIGKFNHDVELLERAIQYILETQ